MPLELAPVPSLLLVVNLLELLRSFVKCESELPAQGQRGKFICVQSLRGYFPCMSPIGPWLWPVGFWGCSSLGIREGLGQEVQGKPVGWGEVRRVTRTYVMLVEVGLGLYWGQWLEWETRLTQQMRSICGGRVGSVEVWLGGSRVQWLGKQKKGDWAESSRAHWSPQVEVGRGVDISGRQSNLGTSPEAWMNIAHLGDLKQTDMAGLESWGSGR